MTPRHFTRPPILHLAAVFFTLGTAAPGVACHRADDLEKIASPLYGPVDGSIPKAGPDAGPVIGPLPGEVDKAAVVPRAGPWLVEEAASAGRKVAASLVAPSVAADPEAMPEPEPKHGRAALVHAVELPASEVEQRPLASPPESQPVQADQEQSSIGAGLSPAAEIGFGRTAAALAGVVALAMVLAAVLRSAARRRGGLMLALGPAGRAPSGVVHVLARYPIQRGQLLVLLKVGPRVLLTCQSRFTRFTGGGMTTLAEFTDPDQVADLVRLTEDAAGASAQAKFRSMLEEAASVGKDDGLRAQRGNDGSTRRRVESPAGDLAEFSNAADSLLRGPDAARPAQRPSSATRHAQGVAARASGYADAGHPDGAEQLRRRLARLRSGSDRGTA